jgi:hypothetical protein
VVRSVSQDVGEETLVAAIIDHSKPAEGTIRDFIGGHRARTIRQRPVKAVGIHAYLRLFSPNLHPVLHRGKGDEDAMISPQVPTRRTGGQTVLDHQPHRQSDHARGVVTAWGCQSGQVCIAVLATLGAVMLRIGDHEITRTPQIEMAQVVQRPTGLLVSRGPVTTTRTRVPYGVATLGDDLWRGQVGNRGHPFAGIGSIRTRTKHGFALLVPR